MDRYPRELSGGMQQRVNIAAALVHQPALLLLDEPFGALDEITREKMVDWLAGVVRQARQTSILVTHSVEEAVTLSDRIIVLSARPAQIVKELRIDLPSQRDFAVRQSSSYLQWVKQTRAALHDALVL